MDYKQAAHYLVTFAAEINEDPLDVLAAITGSLIDAEDAGEILDIVEIMEGQEVLETVVDNYLLMNKR